MDKKFYVLDTNIILEDANQMFKISQDGENLVILPETVIDELDSKKSGFGEINFQAREFARILAESKVIQTSRVKYETSQVTIISVVIGENLFIDIISFDDYNLGNVDPAIMNDRKIIKTAQFAGAFYPGGATLLSNDIMCRTRAISLDVRTEGILSNREAIQYNFIKVVENIDDYRFSSMDLKDISFIDPDYTPENYCYHFKSGTGNEKIGYIVNGKINLIRDDSYGNLPVIPINLGQRFAIAGMCDPRIDVCVIEAIAGSGKTLLAISAGMKMVKEGQYDKIIYIRNSVESVDKAEEVGFLPGLESKFIIYNYPLYDTLEYIVQKNQKKSRDSIEERITEIQREFNIETMWTGAARGRTISNAFVIVDEVQNFAKPSLQTILSRMDKDCKVVCIGSNRQIDHQYINKYTNGLSCLIKAAKDPGDKVILFGTELKKVVRGKITEWAENIFEKK